jgi:hypothetical protein
MDTLARWLGKPVVITFAHRDADDQFSGTLAGVLAMGVIVQSEDGHYPTFVPYSAIENITLGW